MKSELKDLALRLQAIIDTAIDGIITIDSRGTMESVNSAAAKYFGYLKEDLLGQNVKMLMPEPDKSRHDGYIKNYHDTKKPQIIGIGREVVGMRKDRSTFPFRLAVSEVILNDRVIFTGIVHDLSDVKRAQIELKSLNEGLEDLVEKRTTELETVVNKLLQTNRLLEEKEHSLHEALSKERELSQLKSRFVSMASHITLHPAIQLGIDDKVGSIEKGKDGDIAIFSKHPLSIYTIPMYTIVDGTLEFDRNNDEADQRLEVNPNESIPAFIEWDQHDHENDGCMHGVNHK